MVIGFILAILIVGIRSREIGPYYIEVRNLSSCDMTNNHVQMWPYHMELLKEKDKSYVRGSLTIPRNGVRNVVMHAELIKIKYNLKTEKIFEIEGTPCGEKNMLIMLASFMNISFNNCSPKKGNYSMDHLDPDQVSHTLTKVLPYGEFLTKFWWTTYGGTVLCQRLWIQTRPADRKH